MDHCARESCSAKMAVSNGTEREVGRGWEFDADGIVHEDGAACEDDGHDAGAAFALTAGVAWTPQQLLQAAPVAIDLGAGGAEAGDLDDGLVAEVKEGVTGQAEQFQAHGQDVFADLAGAERIAGGGKLFQLFRGEEVHLAEIRLRGIAALLIQVLHGRAAVRIALDAFTGEQVD